VLLGLESVTSKEAEIASRSFSGRLSFYVTPFLVGAAGAIAMWDLFKRGNG